MTTNVTPFLRQQILFLFLCALTPSSFSYTLNIVLLHVSCTQHCVEISERANPLKYIAELCTWQWMTLIVSRILHFPLLHALATCSMYFDKRVFFLMTLFFCCDNRASQIIIFYATELSRYAYIYVYVYYYQYHGNYF